MNDYGWGDLAFGVAMAALCLAMVVAEWGSHGPRIRIWRRRK